MEGLDEDQILASAAQFLIEGHDEDAARVLLACSPEMRLAKPIT